MGDFSARSEEHHGEPAAAGLGRALDALAGQDHPIAHAQLVRSIGIGLGVGLGGQAHDRRRLRLARATIAVPPASLGQARRQDPERRDPQRQRQRAAGVASSAVVAPRAKRSNHGRAQRASELAWRQVLGTVPRERVELARLQNAWPRLVPRHLQEVAWPAGLVDGKLVVHVDDNQWLHELAYLRRELLDKLRRACPTAGLRELRLRVGEVELPPRPEPAPEPVIPGLPREPERATIEAMEAIDDARLRDAVAAARLALGSR